jgi:predicted CXXCH cytochrome family protein
LNNDYREPTSMAKPLKKPQPARRRWRGLRVAILGLVGIGTAVYWRHTSSTTPPPDDQPHQAALFVGTATCAGCHQAEHALWRQSQHRQAMQEPTSATVVGDFSDATFSYAGTTSRFFKKGDEFFVSTDGPTGAVENFRITYTFGVYPLQQYLIEQPGGRLQALSVAWDARPREQGGGRWFHLYPNERVDARDELHWTGRQQNWNFMCADCHSTGVRKGYDATKDAFATSWSELNVACEACHGPGSQHEQWAKASAITRGLLWSDNGLTAALVERKGVTWSAGVDGKPVRSSPRTTAVEVDRCAQCHSRRSQLLDGYVAGARFADFYSASTLDADLYFPDGQQRDEVYTYGSFLQSRMHHAGVTCSDCHDPHSARLRADGNALCGTCHAAEKYNATTHHFHQANSAGSGCVSCHMPARTYMGVDRRRDHSFRVPRPDESVAFGTPNACNECHGDRSPTWAADRVRLWLGRDARGFQTFASAFQTDETAAADADRGLLAIARDSARPPIVRASALARLARYPSLDSAVAARMALADSSPLVRRSALSALDAMPAQERLTAVPLLSDPSRSVRLEAVRVLAPVHASVAGVSERAALARATSEYVASQRFNADRPEARMNLGTFFSQLGRVDEAVGEFRSTIRLAPSQAPGYVNLADALSRQGNEPEAERTLRDGLSRLPTSAELHHALGLSLARAKRTAEATEALGRAAALAPEVARFIYAHAVALHSSGRAGDAIRIVEQARRRHPTDRDLLVALVTFQRDAGRTAEALRAAEELVRLNPTDAEAEELRRSLEAAAR